MIHPTAVVASGATLGDVRIGPFAVIESGATLADGVEIGAHAVVCAGVEVGPRTRIGAHAVVGGPPQDARHDGTATRLVIGAENDLREHVTVHRGSSAGRGLTTLGDGNLLMVGSHVAHDCVVGDGCSLANGATLGGHAVVGDGAVLGGLVAVHQHTRVGRLAMIGGGAMCTQDVPPYSLAQGDRARLYGLNTVGLRRAGVEREARAALKSAWRLLFVAGLPQREAVARARAELGDVAEVSVLCAFVEASTRGVCRAAVGR